MVALYSCRGVLNVESDWGKGPAIRTIMFRLMNAASKISFVVIVHGLLFKLSKSSSSIVVDEATSPDLPGLVASSTTF